MKIISLILILMLLTPISLAKTLTVTLNRGESTVIERVNITLIDYIKKDSKVLICANDEKTILSDDKRVNNVYFEIRSFRDDGVKFILEADCDDCIASDNSKCFLKKENENEIEEEIEDSDLNETSDDENENENETIDDEIGNEAEDEFNQLEEKPYKGILHRLVSWVSSLFSTS